MLRGYLVLEVEVEVEEPASKVVGAMMEVAQAVQVEEVEPAVVQEEQAVMVEALPIPYFW